MDIELNKVNNYTTTEDEMKGHLYKNENHKYKSNGPADGSIIAKPISTLSAIWSHIESSPSPSIRAERGETLKTIQTLWLTGSQKKVKKSKQLVGHLNSIKFLFIAYHLRGYIRPFTLISENINFWHFFWSTEGLFVIFKEALIEKIEKLDFWHS